MVGRAAQIGDIFKICGTDTEVEVAGFDPEDVFGAFCLVTDPEGKQHKVWFPGDAAEFVRPGRFKEACQFNVGDVVYIAPDNLYPKGLKARVVEVDGHPGDSGLLLCEWANESGRLVTALHDPESLLLIEKAEHANQHQA